MTEVHDFVAGLVRNGKSAAEIKTNVDAAYGDKALGLTLIYYILKKVKAGETTEDQHQFNAKKQRGPLLLQKTVEFPAKILPLSMVSWLAPTFYEMI
jgi:hypothetical protein